MVLFYPFCEMEKTLTFTLRQKRTCFIEQELMGVNSSMDQDEGFIIPLTLDAFKGVHL